MTRTSVGRTRIILLATTLALGIPSISAQSRFDIGATVGAGSFHSYGTARGLVLGAAVGIRLSPTLVLAPQISYWTDSGDSFLAVGPELRWVPTDSRRTSLLFGVGIGSESMDYLTIDEGPNAGGGTDYLKSVVATLGAEYLLMTNSTVQPLLQARLAMGLATLEEENSSDFDRGLLFTVGIGVRLGRR